MPFRKRKGTFFIRQRHTATQTADLKPSHLPCKDISSYRKNWLKQGTRFIFTLKIYISGMKIYIFRLNIYIFSLKIKFKVGIRSLSL